MKVKTNITINGKEVSITKNKDYKKQTLNFEECYICNVTNRDEHCNTYCYHGVPHINDHCTQPEFCDIVNKTVKCRHLKKYEYKQYIHFFE